MIVAIEDRNSGEVTQWGFDGEIMLRLPKQNPQTGQFVRLPGEPLLVLRGEKCPYGITIGQDLPGSSLTVTTVTFGGDLVRETGVWEPSVDGFRPQEQAKSSLPNPLDSVGFIMNDVRQKSGLPPNITPMSEADATNVYGLT